VLRRRTVSSGMKVLTKRVVNENQARVFLGPMYPKTLWSCILVGARGTVRLKKKIPVTLAILCQGLKMQAIVLAPRLANASAHSRLFMSHRGTRVEALYKT